MFVDIKYQILILFMIINSAILQSQHHPDLLVYEPFDYAVFNPIWCADVSGIGWTGAWERVIGDDAIIRAENLEYEGLSPDPGNHCAVEFVRAGIRYNRPINAVADDGQVIWVSVIMDFKPGAHPNNVGNITLLKNGNQVFTFGKKFGNEKFGTVWPGVTQYNTNIEAAGLHWMVLKIQFSGDGGEEQAWLWIDPPADTEPDVSTANLTMPQNGLPALRINGGFDAVQLKAEGTAPLLLGYDEFRIGRNFGAISSMVTNISSTPELAERMVVYPNPVSGELSVKWSLAAAKDLKIEMRDLTGRVVYISPLKRYSAGTQQEVLVLETFRISPNIYFLNLVGNNFSITRKVIYLEE